MAEIRFELTADGATEEFTAQGDFRVHIKGDFGGGTLTIHKKIE